MTCYELGAIIISAISAFISLLAIISSWKTSQKTNNIAEDQTKISQGQIELQIHQLISQTKKDLLDISLKVQDNQNEVLQQALAAARELNMNAYEEACAKYLDGKVDRERFKKNYNVEIRQLVEFKGNQEKFDAVTSKYKCILKVYNEWNNLE